MTQLQKSSGKLTVIFAENPVDPTTWVKYDQFTVLSEFLLGVMSPKYHGRFPSTARIYHEYVTKAHDITPLTPAVAEDVDKVTGTVYVVVWPEGQALVIQLGIQVGMFLLATALKALIKEDKATAREVPRGSPNNLPGNRVNNARLMQRIPDIYGRVRSTPDLIAYPYISYDNNLQVEVTLSCIGRGEFDVDEDEVFEGSTPIQFIQGSSVAIYPPGEVPGSGTPQLLIGQPIEDELYTVVECKEVTGEVLLPPNNLFLAGDEDWTDQSKDEKGDGTDFWFTSPPLEGTASEGPLFLKVSPGVGRIIFNYLDQKCVRFLGGEEITSQFAVGDKVGLDWKGRLPPPGATESDNFYYGGVSVHYFTLVMGDENEIPDLSLLPSTADDEHYVILDIDASTPEPDGKIELVSIDLEIPASKEAEWDKIALFNDGSYGTNPDGYASAGTMYNRAFMLYKLNYVQGPFFINDTSMEEVHLNFVAEKGIWIDDGTKQLQYGAFGNLNGETFFLDNRGVGITIELTPADENGDAIGPKELFDHTIAGSATRRDFIGQTVKIIPSFTGRFLISVYRNSAQYWRRELPSFRDPTDSGDGRNWRRGGLSAFLPQDADDDPDAASVTYTALSMAFEDEVKWTHCYSISSAKYTTGSISDLGNVTIVHNRLSQVRNSVPRDIEKRLNMIVTRKTGQWDDDEEVFDPTPVATQRSIDALFSMLLDPKIGNVQEENIDFSSIHDAFVALREAFGDTAMLNFDHTFDAENSSVEDMLQALADSSFLTIYRQGNLIKAKPDIATTSSTLIFNHRNKLIDTETREVTFGQNEENYDGVEIEYSELPDDQKKIYGIPAAGILTRPRKLSLAGVKSKKRAATLAWRAYNRLLYQDTAVEFEAWEEAAVGVTMDRVLVSDSTTDDFTDGYIVAIDGLTIYTSQPVTMNGTDEYILNIQNVDGTVQVLPVVTVSASDVYELVLDGAPSGDLVINKEDGTFPQYKLSRVVDSHLDAFHVMETEFKSQGVYKVTAVNYSNGYYFNDGLRLYIPFEATAGYPPVRLFDDRSPYEFDWDSAGATSVVTDPTTPSRGAVFESFDDTGHIQYENFSTTGADTPYTIAVWLYRNAAGSVQDIFAHTGDNTEGIYFFINADDEFEVQHDGVTYLTYAGSALEEWEHIVIDFNPELLRLLLYVNGVQESIAGSVPSPANFTDLTLFENYIGRADNFRFYRGAHSAEFINELYLKEQVY